VPDIDSSSAYINKKIKPLDKISNFLTKHRGALHSITLCIIFTIVSLLVLQKFALPFFLGYSLHILADSFTVAGVRAFWPSNINIRGFIRTGSLAERILFYLVIIADAVLLLALIK
jgi:inner membrane protein